LITDISTSETKAYSTPGTHSHSRKQVNLPFIIVRVYFNSHLVS
jgi:hypothetical protein